MAKEKRLRISGSRVLLLSKGKKKLLNLVFGRTAVILLLLAAQAVLIFFGFLRLGQYVVYTSLTVSFFVALAIINRPDNPAVKITWISLIMVAPVFAVPFYFYVKMDLGHRLARDRLTDIRRRSARYAPDCSQAKARLEEQEPRLAGLANYAERFCGNGFFENSDVEYLPSGEAFFDEILAQLEQAERFIFLESFIVEEGYMLGRVLDVLERKARQGVEVRVMYDGTCAVAKVPYQYPRELEKLGIRCKMYAPLRLFMSTHYNNRDHRKILVIDGRVAFTGGVNLADEYINRRSPFGHWKDTAVMISGEAVRGYTMMFLQMWGVSEPRDENYQPYLDASGPVEGEGFVLPYGDSPFDDENVGETVYMDILERATRYVHITTPYLILDHEMITALAYAAKRGVEVIIITPAIPDKKAVFAVTRSYYWELIRAGVDIYEYTPGFIHAKMFVSDDATAVVGSINLDYRSLYHHFECAALLHRCPAVADVEQDFQTTLAQCRRIQAGENWKERPLRRLLGWVLRPLAPLM